MLFFQVCSGGFRGSVVLSCARGEEANEPELVVSQRDHAGKVAFMGLPVDSLQKLEDPAESRTIRHLPQFGCEARALSGLVEGENALSMTKQSGSSLSFTVSRNEVIVFRKVFLSAAFPERGDGPRSGGGSDRPSRG